MSPALVIERKRSKHDRRQREDAPIVIAAGQAFYRAPGHAPLALEGSEYVDVSPTEAFAGVIDHVRSAATA